MKAKTISIVIDDIKIKGPSERMAQLLIAGLITQALPPAANVQPVTVHSVPALGAEWPGQGGFNGGLVAARGDVPAHYLIIAKEDIGAHEWGGRGKESGGTSKADGLANSETLQSEGGHPAIEAVAAYTTEGHTDFYLPACAELYHCWVNVPELFAKDTWYWSSSQRSANYAFDMHFAGGSQTSFGKGLELRVRPVRRFFI
ncbi:Lcl C-terminal domain-containing protein [Pseudomonas sp. RT6P73]